MLRNKNKTNVRKIYKQENRQILLESPEVGFYHIKKLGCLLENMNLTPKGDQSGYGLSFFSPLKDTCTT